MWDGAPGPVKTHIFREAPSPATKAFVGPMVQLIEAHGVTPDAFAARVFDAIDRQRRHITGYVA